MIVCMDMELWLKAAAVLAAWIGGLLDLKTHKIPNRLTITGMFLGLAVRGLLWGMAGLAEGLAGLGIGCIPIMIWLLGGIKAGDVKLYMLTGVLGGWKFCFLTEVCSILLGGVMSIILMCWRQNLLLSLKRLWLYMQNLVLAGNSVIYEGSEKSRFCFGWLIGVGTLFAFFWE